MMPQCRQEAPLRLFRACVFAGVRHQRLQGEAAPRGARLSRPPLWSRGVPGWQFNTTFFGFSFGLKMGLIFHFDYVICLNYTFFNFFLV